MTLRELVDAPRSVAAALLLLLVVQGIAVGALRHDAHDVPAAVACGTAVPPVDREVPLDASLQLRAELTVAGRSSGTAVLVIRAPRPIAVLSTQAVLIAPARQAPVSP